MFSKSEGYAAGYKPAILPRRSTKYELLQKFRENYKFSLFYWWNLSTAIIKKYVTANLIDGIDRVTTSDMERYNEWEQITTSDNRWQCVV